MEYMVLILSILLLQNSAAFAGDAMTKSGYKGDLPNIERFFEYKRKSSNSIPQNFEDGTAKESALIKAPLDDDLFLDLVIKKEKYSPYVKDILKILTLFESFRTLLLTGDNDIQKINAQVNMIDLYTNNLMQNYGSDSYAFYDSYIWCQKIAYSAKLFGNLMYDANYYSKYMPITHGQYSAQNVKSEKENLIKELEKAIFTLKQLQ